MDQNQKQQNRYKFRLYAFLLVVATLILGATLSYYGKADSFGAIAVGVMTFAGAVFGADYFSTPKE
jgi:hypothetical protein